MAIISIPYKLMTINKSKLYSLVLWGLLTLGKETSSLLTELDSAAA